MTRPTARQYVAGRTVLSREVLLAALPLLGGCGRFWFDPVVEHDAGVDAFACADVICLDPSFDGDGIETFDIGGVDNANFVYRALAVQPDDRLVLGGAGGAPGAGDLVAVRLTEEGAFDPTFGVAGIASIDAGGTDERAIGVALDAQGRVLLAGATGPTTVAGVIARLTVDGGLDPTFDGDGILTNDVNATGPVAFNGVTVDAAGRIVVAGQAFFGDYNWIVLRVLADGTPDDGLGGSGLTSIDIGLKDQFGTLGAVTSAGIVVVGQAYNGTNFDGTLLRLNESGAPDGTFGTSGIATTELGDSDRYFAAALDASGAVIAGGQTLATDDDMLIARFTPAGVPDPAFGTAGTVRIDRGPDENVRGVAVLPDGRIAVAGHREVAGARVSVIALLEPTGAVIDVRDVDLGPGTNAIQDLELDHHGRVVALGSVADAIDPAITDFAIARFIIP